MLRPQFAWVLGMIRKAGYGNGKQILGWLWERRYYFVVPAGANCGCYCSRETTGLRLVLSHFYYTLHYGTILCMTCCNHKQFWTKILSTFRHEILYKKDTLTKVVSIEGTMLIKSHKNNGIVSICNCNGIFWLIHPAEKRWWENLHWIILTGSKQVN